MKMTAITLEALKMFVPRELVIKIGSTLSQLLNDHENCFAIPLHLTNRVVMCVACGVNRATFITFHADPFGDNKFIKAHPIYTFGGLALHHPQSSCGECMTNKDKCIAVS